MDTFRPSAIRGGDSLAIERAISAQQHDAGRCCAAEAFHGGEDVANKLARAAGRARRSFPQPRPDDDRRRLRRGDDADQSVQPADSGVAEACALLLISVDFFDGVVNIDQGIVVDSGDDWGDCDHVDQPTPGDGVELTDVTKRERSKERSQRRRGVGSDEEFLHTAVSQQRHVVNRVCAGEHARDQRCDFQSGVRAEVSGQAQPRIGELPETRFHRQRQRGNEPCGRHEICVVEGG